MQSSQDHFQVHHFEMNLSDCNVCGETFKGYFAFGIHMILFNVTIMFKYLGNWRSFNRKAIDFFL